MDYLNKRLMTEKLYLFLFIIALTCRNCQCYGYDAGATCSEKTARRGRAQLLKSIPCDLTIQAYCNLPGTLYPWNAVRRFVNENQGMMKRMYGDVRHISVLRTEINNNDIALDDVEETAIRYSRAGWKRNKYLHQASSKSKNNDLLSDAHYRRRGPSATNVRAHSTTKAPSTTTETIISTSAPTTTSTTTEPSLTTKKIKSSNEKREKMTTQSDHEHYKYKKPYDSVKESENEYEEAVEAAIEEIFVQFQNDDYKTVSNDNDVLRNVTETPIVVNESNSNDNIQIVGAPDLSTKNKTEAATISTTLRIYGFSTEEKVTTQSPLNVNETTTEKINVTDDLSINQNNDTVKVEGDESQIEKKGENDDDVVGVNDEEDSTSAESLQSEQIVDLDGKKTDKLSKPSENAAAGGQLFEDVAQEEEPVVMNARGVNACPVKEEVVAPFWANNTRGEVLALLNLYPFEQYVHWEKCTQEHKQMYCRDGCRCEQQYRLHRLLAYDPQNECRGIFSDWFRFPSCCICKCYDIPLEYRVTSRSPRSLGDQLYNDENEAAEKWRKSIYDDENDEHNFDDERYRRHWHDDREMNMFVQNDEELDF